MALTDRERRLLTYGAAGVGGFILLSRAAQGGGDEDRDGGDGVANVGGGDYYSDTFTRERATHVVTSENGLRNALSGASSGDVIFVAGEIHTTSHLGTVDTGVTLASGRGGPDTTGRVVCDAEGFTAVSADPGSRVTGLVVEGYETGYRRNNAFRGQVPDSWIDWIGGKGIRASGDARIDNCEVFGHERAIIASGSTLVEHCDVHHCLQGGTGYGIRASGDAVEIRNCTLDYNRHSIAASGSTRYHAHHNWCGPNHVGHVFDHHGVDGGPEFNGTVEINNNMVEQYIRIDSLPGANTGSVGVRGAGSPAATVNMRGIPNPAAKIHHNWTFHEEGPFPGGTSCCIGEGGDYHCPAINQWDNDAHLPSSCDSYYNMDVYANHYGSTEPTDPSIGLSG